jgi:phage shock protein E
MYKWVISLMLFVGCADSTQPNAAIRDIDVEEAASLLKQDATVVVLDIRTPQEFQQGHIAGAENIDFRSPEFRKEIEVLGRDKPYLVHCASGGRSTRSLSVFEELQFKQVYHLEAGINGWLAAGHRVKH